MCLWKGLCVPSWYVWQLTFLTFQNEAAADKSTEIVWDLLMQMLSLHHRLGEAWDSTDSTSTGSVWDLMVDSKYSFEMMPAKSRCKQLLGFGVKGVCLLNSSSCVFFVSSPFLPPSISSYVPTFHNMSAPGLFIFEIIVYFCIDVSCHTYTSH